MARWTAGAIGLVCACGRVDFIERMDASDEATPGDTDTDAAAPVCRPEYLVCDSFDGVTIDPTTWTTFGVVSRDPAIGRRGTPSARLHLNALAAGTNGGSRLDVIQSFAAGPSTMWIRGWFRINGLPISTNAMELVTISQTGGPGNGDSVFLRASDTQLYHQFDGQGSGAGVPPPLDTWFCLVWKLVRSTTATGGSELTSDVIPPVVLAASITDGTQPMDALSFGPFFASANVDVDQPALDLWIDDVIVSPLAVTCAD